MKPVFIETKRVAAFREAAKIVSDAQKGQPGLMLVWGNPGRGKTECAKEWAVRSGALYIRVMQNWSAKAMLNTICSKINGMELSTVDKVTKILMQELDDNPRVIMIDEADRLKPDNIEHLRDIHDETGAPMIFIGEPSLYSKMILSEGRTKSRVTKLLEFGQIVPEDVMLFGLKAAELKIEPEAAQMLCVRSGGDFRYLWQDVRDLEIAARANSTNTIAAAMVKSMPVRYQGPKEGRRVIKVRR